MNNEQHTDTAQTAADAEGTLFSDAQKKLIEAMNDLAEVQRQSVEAAFREMGFRPRSGIVHAAEGESQPVESQASTPPADAEETLFADAKVELDLALADLAEAQRQSDDYRNQMVDMSLLMQRYANQINAVDSTLLDLSTAMGFTAQMCEEQGGDNIPADGVGSLMRLFARQLESVINTMNDVVSDD